MSTVEPVASDEELALKIGSYLAISNVEVEDIKYIREMLGVPTTSPEPDAVREEIARIVDPESWRWRDAISSIGPVEYVYSTRAQQDRVWLEERGITTPAEITEWCKKQDHSLSRGFVHSLKQADAILAALSRPAHGVCNDLRKTLQNVRAAIMEADPAILSDTLWMPQRLSPAETAVDHIDLALSRNDRQTGEPRS